MIHGDEYDLPAHTAPMKTARQVLDLHADLHRYLTTMGQVDRDHFADYGIQNLMVKGGVRHEWAASSLHPATDLRNLDPWLDSLGRDLERADTYQVTAEMIDLAKALSETTPNLDDLVPEDLPSDSGFMWLDKPIDRPSEEDKPGQQPLVMHAISWVRIPALPVTLGDLTRAAEAGFEIKPGMSVVLPGTGDHPALEFALGRETYVPAVRIREWGWNDSENIAPRPLHMMGQSVVPLTERITSPLRELHLVKMIWILMGMEIVATTPHRTNRAGARRAEKLRKPAGVRVVTLRRTRHEDSEEGPRRRVDWSCTWLVRGHYRYPSCDRCGARHHAHMAPGWDGDEYVLPDGRDRTWIAPYIKGPEGLPLRASDILYKLAR